jgi:hypothetical protein
MPSRSTLHVSRPPGKYRDAARSYRIGIDGADYGTIKASGTLSIEVPSGKHVVIARIDWTGSHPVSIAFEPSQTVYIRVEPNGGILSGLYQVFTTDSWIRVTMLGTQP